MASTINYYTLFGVLKICIIDTTIFMSLRGDQKIADISSNTDIYGIIFANGKSLEKNEFEKELNSESIPSSYFAL